MPLTQGNCAVAASRAVCSVELSARDCAGRCVLRGSQHVLLLHAVTVHAVFSCLSSVQPLQRQSGIPTKKWTENCT